MAYQGGYQSTAAPPPYVYEGDKGYNNLNYQQGHQQQYGYQPQPAHYYPQPMAQPPIQQPPAHYYPQPAPIQQQSSHNVVVVNNAPSVSAHYNINHY